MPSIYYIIALIYLMGITTGLIFANIRERRHQKKIERIYLPEYDRNNPINGGTARAPETVETEYGTLYVIHPGNMEV